MSRSKAKVAIVYSSSDRHSSESRNLAFYVCGLLCRSGWAHCVMIPHGPNGSLGDISASRISFIPPKEFKPVEVPLSDVTFAHWSILSEVHMVVSTVNAEDTVSCAQKLVEGLENRKHIPVFSLQRGVKQSTIFSDEAEAKGLTILEAAVGFAVVLDPRSSALVSTVPRPGIVYQRLSKEEVKIADGPLRLLETMPMPSYFRKTITPYVWGMTVFELLHALNILTKGSIADTLNQRKFRLIYALMIREATTALIAAARGGGWKPELLPLTEMLSLKMWEMILLLPTPFFVPIAWFFGLLPTSYVISPGQLDLMEGRRTATTFNLGELVSTGEKYKKHCKLCDVVLRILQAVEAPLDKGKFASTYAKDSFVERLEQKAAALYPTHESYEEFMFYLFRILAGVSVLFVLIFLFYHD